MTCSIHGRDLSSLCVQSSQLHLMVPAPYLMTATAHLLIAWILFLPFNFTSAPSSVSSYTPSDTESSSPLLLLCLILESLNICIHPRLFVYCLPIWKGYAIYLRHLSSLENQYTTLLQPKFHPDIPSQQINCLHKWIDSVNTLGRQIQVIHKQ